jgi:hypothetical protein
LTIGSKKAAAHRLGLSHSTVKHRLASAPARFGLARDIRPRAIIDLVVIDPEPARRAVTPAVFCIPSSDYAFRAAILAALDHRKQLSPEELQEDVARVYPAVAVRRRDLSSEPVETWYAYRDGVFAVNAPATSWADTEGTAWARINPATGEILEANEALERLLATNALAGRLVTEFVMPGAEHISESQRRAVQEAGETRSFGMARLGDGTEVMLEYVARAHADGIHAWYRGVALVRRT